MDEVIELLDKNGKPTGESCLKSTAHENGLYHATVHVWFYNKKNQILIQKRSVKKSIFPNLWDVSVAGHIPYKETTEDAACRETLEEIGLEITPNQLEYIDNFTERIKHNNSLIDYELHHIFKCKLTVNIEQLTPQNEEVSDLKLIKKTELNELISSREFVPHSKPYFNLVFHSLFKTP